MQKILPFIIISLIVFSCGPSKKAMDISIGTWDYTLKGTPNGDITGNFVIAKDGDEYAGSLNSSQGSLPFKTINVDENGQLNATFDYGNYEVIMVGQFEGNTFDGSVSADYNKFMVTAQKQE